MLRSGSWSTGFEVTPFRTLLFVALGSSIVSAAPKPALKVTLGKTKAIGTRAWLITQTNGNQRLTISLEDPASASVDVCNKPKTAPAFKRFPAYLSIQLTLGTSSATTFDLGKVPMPIVGVSYMKTEKAHVAAPTGTIEGTLDWLPSQGAVRRVRVHGKAPAREMAAADRSVVLDAPDVTFDGEIDVVVCPPGSFP